MTSRGSAIRGARRGEPAGMPGRAIVGGFALLVLFSPGPDARAVTNLCVNPGGTGGCFATIQAAIDAAVGATEVDVAAGSYAESIGIPKGRIITLRGAGAGQTIIDNGTFGGITNRARLAISGFTFHNGQLQTREGGRSTVQGISLEAGASVSVMPRSSLKMSDSTVESDGDGIGVGAGSARLSNVAVFGGGVAVGGFGEGGSLEMDDCRVEGVQSDFSGAVIARFGSRLTIRRSAIVDNQGSGVEAFPEGASVRIIDTLISGNGHPGVSSGGGIDGSNAKRLRIENCTISGNTAFQGAGMTAPRNTTIKASTITGNTGSRAAGLVVTGAPASISNSTISSNVASNEKGGIWCSSGGCFLAATIIADNQATNAEPDCSGSFVSKGFNLIEDPSTCSIAAGKFPDLPSADPMLDVLADNGGPTPTQALLPGSPAIGVVTRLCGTRDQRGVKRRAPCDAGAYEIP